MSYSLTSGQLKRMHNSRTGVDYFSFLAFGFLKVLQFTTLKVTFNCFPLTGWCANTTELSLVWFEYRGCYWFSGHSNTCAWLVEVFLSVLMIIYYLYIQIPGLWTLQASGAYIFRPNGAPPSIVSRSVSSHFAYCLQESVIFLPICSNPFFLGSAESGSRFPSWRGSSTVQFLDLSSNLLTTSELLLTLPYTFHLVNVWFEQVTRLYKNKEHAEVEFTVRYFIAFSLSWYSIT